MDGLLVMLPGLGCAVVMGGMMWFMSRDPKHSRSAQTDERSPIHESEVSELRAEIERLRAEVRERGQQQDGLPL